MAITSVPNVLVYVREKGGKRTFYPAPSVPDLTANYWLRYERAGKQAWQRVGHYDLVAKAKLLLERRLSAVAQGFILPEDQVPEKPSSARLAIQVTVNAYLASLRTKKRPAKSISDKERDIGYFTAFCKKQFIDEIVAADLLDFREHQRAEKYAERTVYNHLTTVTTFLKKNGLYKLTGLLETEDWPELADTDPDPYTEEEVRNFLASASAPLRLVIRFFVGTGCREEEVAHVEWIDIDWVRKIVWIRAKPQHGWKPKTAAGTRKIRLSDALLADLKARQITSTNPLLFPASRGGVEGHFGMHP